MIRVTVWNENVHEKTDPRIAELYPGGLHGYIASFLGTDEEIKVRTATLDRRSCGLTDKVLENTDVLVWWGHCAHDKVPDRIVEKVYKRVMCGMGLVVLHSGHHSKVFKRLMGTTCNLCWRDGDRERVWTVNPAHPIAQGIPEYFNLDCEEMYGERFDIPEPDELVFLGWFSGGEVFRSGCCWRRGLGKIFYFQPGHESNPSFQNEYVQRIIKNGIHWAAPVMPQRSEIPCPHVPDSPEKVLAEGKK